MSFFRLNRSRILLKAQQNVTITKSKNDLGVGAVQLSTSKTTSFLEHGCYRSRSRSLLMNQRFGLGRLIISSYQRQRPMSHLNRSSKQTTQVFQGFINAQGQGQNYTTSAKPHMTRSLHKWKRRKRKSKAQQVKELESLQQDLIKLLSKRAIQVVQDKSLLGGHRQVVLSNAFSQSGLHDEESRVGTPVTPDGVFDHFCTSNSQTSDDIAQVIDSRLGIINKTNGISRLNLNIEGRKNVLLHSTTGVGNETKLSNSLTVYNHDSNNQQISGLEFDAKPIIEMEPISYSDVFYTHRKKKSHVPKTAVSDVEFETAVDRLLAEISSHSSGSVLNYQPEWYVKTTPESDSSVDLPSLQPIGNSSYETKTNQDHGLPRQYNSNLSLSQSSKLDDFKKISDSERLVTDHSYENIPHGRISAPTFSPSPLPQSIFVHEPDDFMDEHHEDHDSKSKLKTVHSKSKRVKAKPLISADTSPDESPGTILFGTEIKEMINQSFVEASCFAGCELMAVRNLQYYATKFKVNFVRMFNTLMHCLAKKGEFNTIRSLFLLLRQQGLEPNLQTYAACLECIGRMSHGVDVHVVSNLLVDIKKSGMDLRDIARRCSYQTDEFDHVLKAIRSVEPDFEPGPFKFNTKYNNPLLLDLNKCCDHNQYAIDMSHDEIMRRAKQQMDMEVKGEVQVRSIAAGTEHELNPIIRNLRLKLLTQWRESLLDAFDQKLAVYEKKAQENVNMTLYPFLKLLPREEYVRIIFKCLKDLLTVSSGYSPTLQMIKIDLGLAVNRKFNTALKVAGGMDKKVLAVYDHYIKDFMRSGDGMDNHRHMWLKAMSHSWDTQNMDLSLKRWPIYFVTDVGGILLDMILYNINVDANILKKNSPKRLVPAFSTMSMYDKNQYTIAELKLHPVVYRLFEQEELVSFTFPPSVVPMLVPPVPWLSKNVGSLMLGSNSLVRSRLHNGSVDALKRVKVGTYSAVLDSLNTLSACAWQINKPILDLQIEIFNNKGDEHLKIAPSVSELPPLPVIKQGLTTKEKAELYRARIALQQQRNDAHGLWCTDLYRLSIANKFRDEIFWFPHSLDFRGRTYPLPPHFNHLGGDNVRGMLLFAKGEPLGKDGYDWLKIHLVNLTGLKKRNSNADRLEYAKTIMDDILDSADKPLTGRRWWQQSDEPWQTLACCMEVAKIERCSGDKADYICHFPVHQDGSCNGLQHYAAIGRDQTGAESVNLFPFNAPKDVYSDVVDLVEKSRQADADEGVEIAKTLEGFIKRKVIKQTIMTTVYGVTRYGAREQIMRQLKDIPGFPEQDAWRASGYLTSTTFNSLREMFASARNIQDWLTDASGLISTFAPIDWITPLGFPVIQPYLKPAGSKKEGFHKYKPNVMKQKNGFPPNYIHSLDSTHMMLTALYCMKAGITFVSVHDCYWTHACDIPVMNRICREQFVNMHKQPLLEDLSKHLATLIGNAERDPHLVEVMERVDVPSLLKLLQNVPKRGMFDLDNVLDSTYFFS